MVSASATGTLIPAAQVDVSFKCGGLLTEIYVSVGDEVEKGQLLAQLDAQSARIQLEQTKRALWELTSPAATALAKQNVAQAQQDVDSAIATLKYLISPTVYYWEGEVGIEVISYSANNCPSLHLNSQELNFFKELL